MNFSHSLPTKNICNKENKNRDSLQIFQKRRENEWAPSSTKVFTYTCDCMNVSTNHLA